MKIVAVVFVTSLATTSFAQIFGVKAGFNLSTILEKDDFNTYSEDYKMKPGFHAGVTMDLPLVSILSFESALLVSTKGFRIDEDFSVSGQSMNVKGKVNLVYLDIPLTAKATFDVNRFKVYGAFGPYLGLGLSGKSKFEERRDGQTIKTERDIDWGNDEIDDDLMRLDLGLTAGVGVEISAFQIGLTYGHGLMNISPYDNFDYRIKNRVLGLSVGYRFGVD